MFKNVEILPKIRTYSNGKDPIIYTAKNQYRKLETNIFRKELRGHSPNFHIHVSVSDLYIPTIDLPIFCCSAGNIWPDLGIYKLLTDT
jgi:hypothetical protein